MAEKTKLLTSKKKIEKGKWNYRGFIVEKDGSKWVAKVPTKSNIPKEKAESVIDDLKSSAKNICLEIDKVLGPLTEAEKVKPKRKNKTKAQRLKEKEEKTRFLERATRVAYDIRNTINVLTKLKQKTLVDKVSGNEMTSVAPNMRKTLPNGYKIGWENGCLYDLPEITEEVESIVEKDKEIVDEFRSKYEDLDIEFFVDESKIDIKVTYKDKM